MRITKPEIDLMLICWDISVSRCGTELTT